MLREKVRIFDKKVTEIRVSEIRVSEIRISSNHRELHGAIFSELRFKPASTAWVGH